MSCEYCNREWWNNRLLYGKTFETTQAILRPVVKEIQVDHDGDSIYIEVKHCPMCGRRL